MIELDTHVVVWLHAGEIKRFPKPVRTKLDSEELGICPIVLLELEYLNEIDRITVPADRIFADLATEIGLRVMEQSFSVVVRKSLQQDWTRDPFDRIISAHALLSGNPLATKDAQLRKHCSNAFWD